MARYHEHLQYHEDNIEKHLLTADEAKFLLELQHEMNTQDHLSQADPRFWVIKGTEKEYGIETGYEDGANLVEEDCTETLATDIPTAMEYISKHLLSEINETDGLERKLELEKGIFHPTLVVKWVDDGIEDSIELDSMEEICDWLREQGYEHRVANYRIKSIIYPDTMFLTQKDAEEHLRSNYYHYSEDAHTYAMTSWRSPRIEKLVKLLHEVDWEKYRRKAADINPEFENAVREMESDDRYRGNKA